MINRLHYISQGATAEEQLDNIQKACQYGAELVQLRLKNKDEKTVLKTAMEARELTAHFQTRLIINDFYKIAKAVKADGVHLGKSDACPLTARKILASWQIIGGTANTLADCKALCDKKVDYIGLGPYRYTTTKKNLSPVLGITGYRDLIAALQTQIPIIAIGGITTSDIAELLTTGIYGIAMSGEITKNFNQIKILNQLLQTGCTQEQKYNFNNANT